MIFINPHKCCTFVTEKSCLTSNANLCIIQKLKLLPSHYLYWGETLVNRSFLAIRHILAEFFGKIISSDTAITAGITTGADWLNLVGLALLPTIVSTATLAIASRNIGATKASVLGVFEPITAIVVGTLMFGEPLTTNIIVGISIAMVAVTFMITVTKR